MEYVQHCLLLQLEISVTKDVQPAFIPHITLMSATVGRDSSVGIFDSLRAGRSGNQTPMKATYSTLVQTVPGSHPAFRAMGIGRGVALTSHSHLAPRFKGR